MAANYFTSTIEEFRFLVDSKLSKKAKLNLCAELQPILEDLILLDVPSNEHPSVLEMYTWLVQPCRSSDEFSYIQLSLGRITGSCPVYLDKMAAEALAVQLYPSLLRKDNWFMSCVPGQDGCRGSSSSARSYPP